MAPRPTEIYPVEPQINWFLKRESKLSSFNAGSAAGSGSNLSSAVDPSGAAAWMNYMAAHKQWRDLIVTIDDEAHDRALLRRAREHLTEKIDPSRLVGTTKKVLQQAVAGQAARRNAATGEMNPAVPDLPEIAIVKTTELKKAVAPVLSTKPEKVEKREARKTMASELQKVKARALVAKAETLKEKTGDKIVAELRLKEEKAKAVALHRFEEKAAESALKRAKAIGAGSKDFVTEIKPEEGWKVVTRKKGANYGGLGHVVHPDGKTTAIHGDGAVVNASRILGSTSRAPTVQGINK